MRNIKCNTKGCTNHKVRKGRCDDCWLIMAIDRFFSNVEEQDNGCWQWTGSVDKDGYSVFNYLTYTKDKIHRGHRFSHSVFNMDELKDGLVVMHSCNNTSCVNPNHLSQGTHNQNMDYMLKCGRKIGPRGEKQGQSKLTEQIVRQIYIDYRINKIGSSYKVAEKYNISRTTVSSIANGYNWKHLELHKMIA